MTTIQSTKHRKWLGLLAIMPAIGMVFTDQAVLPVALPTIQKHLEATPNELWWSVNSYLLVSAVLLLAGGKFGDRIGYRQAFAWGIGIFALASALCGLSIDVNWLIGARAFQGVGAALMIPASSPLIMSLFPQNERGKAIGVNVSISSLFLIVAPLIGGYFTEYLSWRWIFWINLPLAIVGLFLVFRYVPPSSKGGQSIDPWGFLFFVISSSCLVIWTMQGGEWGWFSSTSGMALALCFFSGVLLMWRERRGKHPFIDLSLFRHPIYKAVNISVFATQFVLMITVYRAVFFQDALDWSPMKSGVVFFVTSIPVLFTSPIGGWLADRFGSKIPIAMGFTLLTFSFFWLAFFVQNTLAVVLIGLFAFGVGIPLVFTPSYSSAMGAVPPKKAGEAFGVLATVRSLSASLGVGVISSVANYIQFGSLSALVEKNPLTKTLEPSFWEHLMTGARQMKESFTSEELQIVLGYWKESQLQAFFTIHLGMGFVLMIASSFAKRVSSISASNFVIS